MTLTPAAAFGLVAVVAGALIGFGFLDVVGYDPAFQWSFFAPGAALIAWSALLFGTAQRRGRTFTLQVSFRKQHYVQACAQLAVFVYWGWYWRTVYDSAFLIAAQVVFAYAFTMLLDWSRRDSYTLGFGPFPVIFSINLFLWFGDQWFYLQFLLVALGFLAKEFIRWDRDGRRVHVFNPSSFPLAVFSLGLILTGTSDLTWGQDIAIFAVLSAADLSRAVPGGAPRAVPFRCGVDDDVGSRRQLSVRPVCTLLQPVCTSSTTPISQSPCSSGCTSCSPTRQPRRGPSWVAYVSECSTAWGRRSCMSCSDAPASRRSTTSYYWCQC